MNENIDLTKILKDCPSGTKLYTPIWGEVTFVEVFDSLYPIRIYDKYDNRIYLSKYGHYLIHEQDSECILFPSKEQRDWSKFTAPWYKKDKFDPNTLKPFDKVLARHKQTRKWFNDFYSFMYEGGIATIGNGYYDLVIPYNEETKHLVGTNDEAPEYYRYWED